MRLTSNVLDGILFGKKEVFLKIYLFLLFGFGFSAYYLNRPGLSKIAVVLLLLIFVISVVRLIVKRDFKIDVCFVFSFVILSIVLISNFISNVFSYDFIVLIGILYCSYLFAKLNPSRNLFLSLTALTAGASLGCCLIFVHYLRTGLSNYLDSYFGNADGIADGAASFIILSFALFLSTSNKCKIKTILSFLAILIPFLLMVILFKRIGPLFKLFFSFFICLEIIFWKKNKYLALGSIVVVLIFLIVMLATPFENSILRRIQQSFIQIKYLNYYIEGSVRERTLMLFRDFDYSLRFPIVGNGMYDYLNYNVVASHNLFGSIGGDYSLIVAFLLMCLPFFFFKKTRNKKHIKPISVYFLFIICFSAFYGTAFLSRMIYFVAGSLFATADQTSFAIAIERYKTRINKVYK